MSERKLWHDIKHAHADDNGCKLQRIESNTALGIPDLYFCIDGVSGWCELKFITSFPKKGGIVRVPHYTKAQKEWLYDLYRVGGLAVLCLRVGQETFWFVGKQCIFVGSITENQIRERSVAMGNLGLRDIACI